MQCAVQLRTTGQELFLISGRKWYSCVWTDAKTSVVKLVNVIARDKEIAVYTSHSLMFLLSCFVAVYPFVGLSTVTKMCSSVCSPSDVDGIGMTRPVTCCYSNLCNIDGAASLRISFVPVGMLASAVCGLFWSRLWGAEEGMFLLKNPTEKRMKPCQPSFAFRCLMDYLQHLPQMMFLVPNLLP